MRTMCAALLALGLGVAVLGCKKRAEPAPDAPGADPKPPGPTASGKSIITIGKTTTFVTGPKDADGRIDYAAALNERMSKSVTAENNASNFSITLLLAVTCWARSPIPVFPSRNRCGYLKRA